MEKNATMYCYQITYENGNEYEGDINDSCERDGQGKMVFSCGSIYEGIWNKNTICGMGTLSQSPDLDNPKIYKGCWNPVTNIFKGTVFYQDGAKFIGELTYTYDFLKMSKEGYGKMIYKDGEQYFGNWKNNLMSGQGTYIYANGDTYKGDFKNNESNGIGTFTSDRCTYTGHWLNDVYDGYGVLSTNVYIYKGTFLAGNKQGKGIMSYKYTGDVYTGEFKNNLFSGYGSYKWATEEEEYKGYWKSGDMHGTGMIIYADKTIYEGEWENDNSIETIWSFPEELHNHIIEQEAQVESILVI